MESFERSRRLRKMQQLRYMFTQLILIMVEVTKSVDTTPKIHKLPE